MLLIDAQRLMRHQVKTKEKHQDYDRVNELAKKYKILITGENAGLLLRQYVNRESELEFIQRCQMTRAITPAVAASVKKPFYKVIRNQRIRAIVDVKDEAKNEQIQDMIKKFYGSSNRKTKGLPYWLKTRFMNLTFIDPNSWVVVEWDTPADKSETIQARPFEVSARNALNFEIYNDETKWLFTEFPIKFFTKTGTDDPVKKDGNKYTLYDQDYTIVWRQINKEYLISIGYVLAPNQELIELEDSVTYLATVNEPNLKYTAAYRIGYQQDDVTDGRTFVNPFHEGMCFFDKSIKTVSEFDLTMTLHAFPQKIQYAPICKGRSKEKKCTAGYLADGSVCGVCKGTGFAGHTSTMDVITLPMPQPDTKNAEIIDLTKLVAYVTPSIDLIKFQNDYIQQLKGEVHSAVFNSQVFVKKAGGAASTQQGGGGDTSTATEQDYNMQSVYDAIEPFTEKFSDLWEDIVTVLTNLANVNDLEEVDIDHIFPADYKLKTADILLSELKAINESGAPSFMKDAISADLADIVFSGDAMGLLKLKVKRRFFPFNGKDADEIALLLSSPDVPRRSKILYSNFELIFTDIEMETPEFYVMDNPKKQLEVLNAKVEEYKKAITDEAPVLDINMFRSAMQPIPGGAAGAGGQTEEEQQQA